MGRRKKREESAFSAGLRALIKEHGVVVDKESVLEGGLLQEMTKIVVETAMEAELSSHLGYESGSLAPEGQSNRRNGRSKKTVRTEQGPTEIEVPRDREGSFEPEILPKHQRDFRGFDDKILSMYARGMSVRDIQSVLEEMYSVEVSDDLISRVTDGVVEKLNAWQSRPLESVYPVLWVDGLWVKIRDKSGVSKKCVYVVIGLQTDGTKELLGLWVHETEGAAFWLKVLNDLRHRGVEDIFVICADGLKGMPQAVEASFPEAVFQTCVVHLIRSSTAFIPWGERKAVCADLKAIYTALDEEAALQALEDFKALWDKQFPMVSEAWERRWSEFTPFLAYPHEIRRIIYTTNAIEALNRILRKPLKAKGHMPTDLSVRKLLFMAYTVATTHKRWGGRDRYWARAKLQFKIHFGDRFPQS